MLEKCAGTMSKVDPAVIYCMDGEELEGILACHVDDFIWGGRENFKQTVAQQIRQTFKVGKEESKTFQSIGMELFSDGNTILLHQSKYGESLESIPLEKSRAFQKHEVMSAQQKQTYRSKIGQILWTSRQSRPDVVFDACQLASKIDGKVEHLTEANKVIRRIKSEQWAEFLFCMGTEQPHPPQSPAALQAGSGEPKARVLTWHLSMGV